MANLTNKFSREEIDEIKRWAEDNITTVFSSLEFYPDDKGRYLTSCCPMSFHPGDANNNKAFVWSTDKGSWACFTHQCNNVTRGDIIGFVQAFKECSFYNAINILFDIKSNTPIINIKKCRQIHKKSTVLLDKNKLKILMPDRYFIYRGIDSAILKRHSVGYWQKTGTFMDKRAIVPIFDSNNNLVGFSGRTILPDEEYEALNYSKWIHALDFVSFKTEIFDKSNHLYALNLNKDYIKEAKLVYIVEGPMDLWRLEMAGIKNVVATLGINLSPAQLNLLVGLNIEKIVICYDNDKNKAGFNAAVKIKNQLEGLIDVVIKCPIGFKDYGEMSIEEIKRQLNDK